MRVCRMCDALVAHYSACNRRASCGHYEAFCPQHGGWEASRNAIEPHHAMHDQEWTARTELPDGENQ